MSVWTSTLVEERAQVAHFTKIGNFSRHHSAKFFAGLGRKVPTLLDYALAAARPKREALAAVLAEVAAFDRHRRAVGAGSVTRVLIEPVDRSSLLHFAIAVTPHPNQVAGFGVSAG